MKPNALFIAMTALALLLSILACGSSGPPVITDAVTAKRLDENSKPVDQTSNYLPEDVICISVYVENMVIGSSVKVEYKYNGELYEKSELTADQAGSGNYGFSLSPNEYGHVPGNYTADIYLGGVLAKTVAFTVEGEAKTEILAVVLAKGLADDSAPIEPDNTFQPSEVVNISIELKNMLAGSKIKLVYTYEDGQTVEQDMTIESTGSGYLGFTFSPSPAGHPVGNYTLQVFLDGEPYRDTVYFAIVE